MVHQQALRKLFTVSLVHEIEEIGPTSHDDGYEGHEDGQSNRRQKTTNNTHDWLWNLLQPSEPWDSLQVRNLGDDTDNTNWNGPEDNQCSNEANNCNSANNTVPPSDGLGFPDDLVGVDADVSW